MELGVRWAVYRMLLRGQPTSVLAMQTERATLESGWLEKNIRNTKANYARQFIPFPDQAIRAGYCVLCDHRAAVA